MMDEDSARFVVYCLEEYRKEHNMSAPETVRLFEKYGVFDFLEEEPLRWQSLKETVIDIDEFISVRM